ncbi:hypothetical protein BT96DRAFT_944010 [Gymnopus androsaceus JB14]|uniref:Uncharacterized protein n=1 Tax=Gymnopus androsaceus JB14 TaxID=1447944 RepID=A0A6A4H538_9AGAR|nr:hypothetical protein BT96DRAFT_944010 [Gymnopus androsaceus JB14]
MSLEDILAISSETIACTVAICSTFEEKPVETNTFWDLQIPFSSIKGAVVRSISLHELLNAVASQLRIDYALNISQHNRLFKCFENYPKYTDVATIRVPDFTQNVNMEIFGFRSFPGSLEQCAAPPLLETFSTMVFSSDGGNPFTQQLLSNSPEVLMGLQDRYIHPHFIVLLRPPEEIISSGSPFTGPTESPAEPASAQPPSPLSLPVPPPALPPAIANLSTFRDYALYRYEQGTENAVYSQAGGRRRKLWYGIQNHRHACQLLGLAGFTNLLSRDGSESFILPNGTHLSLSEIVASELRWDLNTFKKKYRIYTWCNKYAASHRWNSHLLPASEPSSSTRTRRTRDREERGGLLKIWKGIVAMFGPEGYASREEPPVASGDTQETFAAELTEGNLTQYSKIQPYLVRRDASLAVDRWF